MLHTAAQLRALVFACATLMLCIASCHSCPWKLFKKKRVDEYINKEVVVTHAVAAFHGCFIAGNEVRDLPIFAGAFDNNSPNSCNERCRERMRAYFGLHNGNECWCGDSYGNLSPNPEPQIKCYMSCPGNRKEKCGGPEHNSVYNTTKL